MPFYETFLRILAYRPKAALVALFWYITGRRVRGRNLLRAATADTPYAYRFWIRSIERLEAVVAGADANIAQWAHPPRFTLILPVGSGVSSRSIARTVYSLEAQCYPEWELLLVPFGDSATALPSFGQKVHQLDAASSDAAQALAHGISYAAADFVVPLYPGTVLSVAGLFRLAEAIESAPAADLLYGDHDQIDERSKRSRPWFKPQWNREQFLAQDYVSPACAVRGPLARQLSSRVAHAGEAGAFVLVLEASAHAKHPIVRVPHVLCHLAEVSGPDNVEARLTAVAAHLAPDGASVTAGEFGLTRVHWPLPTTQPLVSIVIPTRDKLELLKTCVDSVLTAPGYANFELVVVDNGSELPETLAWFDEITRDSRVRVLRYDAPFNYSAINNFAVAHARGEYLCLLNNDTEVITADWLEQMMRYAVRKGVGAVGARLLYEDGTIQHAGVIPGLNEAAGHAHRDLRNGDPGYFHQVYIARYVTAVTAACLVVQKCKFEAVGGFDEEHFKVAFNDVDLCLKLDRAGWKNIYVPHAALYHYESRSRGKDLEQRNIDRYLRELATLQERWGTRNYRDPQHHPGLDRYKERYMLGLESERL